MTSAIVALALWTVVIGSLLGFVGYTGHFRRHNPTLFHDLQRQFSFCSGGRVPRDFCQE